MAILTKLEHKSSWLLPLVVCLTAGCSAVATLSPTLEPTVTPLPTATASLAITPSPEPSPTEIASATPEPVTFEAWSPDVVNVLSDLCGRCHNSATLKGDLDLTSYETALAGGGSGPAIVPGNPDASELARVQKGGGHSEMLSGAQLAAILEWIQAGAPQQ